MNARPIISVQQVDPLKNRRLLLLFSNGSSKVFDVAPYISQSSMPDLMDELYFAKVMVGETGVCWPNGEGIAPGELYDFGVRVS